MNFLVLHHLASINFVAVFVSAIIYFILGSLWFTVLFGRAWAQENNFTAEPTILQMIFKMGTTFFGNFVASLSMALLVHTTYSATLLSGLELGLIVATGFAATTIGIAYVWVGRSIKISLIDIGYPSVGIVISAIILSLWR